MDKSVVIDGEKYCPWCNISLFEGLVKRPHLVLKTKRGWFGRPRTVGICPHCLRTYRIPKEAQ